MTTERTTDVETSTNNCTNYFCISDDDYIDKIRDYIFPSTFEWIIVVLYAAVFIGGLAGNALVCIVVWKNTQMRTVTNLFIVNLSTADLLVVLICLPPTVVGDITETWFVGRAFCKLIHYLQVRNSFSAVTSCVVIFSSFSASFRRTDRRTERSLQLSDVIGLGADA